MTMVTVIVPLMCSSGVAEARARRAAGEKKKLQKDYQVRLRVVSRDCTPDIALCMKQLVGCASCSCGNGCTRITSPFLDRDA